MHVTAYCINPQIVPYIICAQDHCVRRAKPTKCEFHAKTKTSEIFTANQSDLLLPLRDNFRNVQLHIGKQNVTSRIIRVG